MMKRALVLLAIALPLGLGGCMAAGKNVGQRLFGRKETTPADKIMTAQETAITAVHGGSIGTPIMWKDEASGIQGALVPESGGDVPVGCRHYQQTVILSGETLQGPVVACAQKDGSWKLFGGLLGGTPPA